MLSQINSGQLFGNFESNAQTSKPCALKFDFMNFKDYITNEFFPYNTICKIQVATSHSHPSG